MAKGLWNIFYEDSGGTFIADGTITPPNQNLSLDKISTRSKRKLADGSDAYMTPETKSVFENLTFQFLADDGTLATKILGYINNDYHIKITDSDGVSYTGYFASIRQVWISGVSPNEYDLEVIFLRNG